MGQQKKLCHEIVGARHAHVVLPLLADVVMYCIPITGHVYPALLVGMARVVAAHDVL